MADRERFGPRAWFRGVGKAIWLGEMGLVGKGGELGQLSFSGSRAHTLRVRKIGSCIENQRPTRRGRSRNVKNESCRGSISGAVGGGSSVPCPGEVKGHRRWWEGSGHPSRRRPPLVLAPGGKPSMSQGLSRASALEGRRGWGRRSRSRLGENGVVGFPARTWRVGTEERVAAGRRRAPTLLC